MSTPDKKQRHLARPFKDVRLDLHDTKELRKKSGATHRSLEHIGTWLAWKEDYERVMHRPPGTSITVDMFAECQAFAYCWATNELLQLNDGREIPVRELAADAYAARWLYVRLLKWALARLSWHFYQTKKDCPDWAHDDPGMAAAATAGWLQSKQSTLNDPKAVEFTRNIARVAPNEWRMFKKWRDKPEAPRWRHRKADSWLMLIWPLVAEHGWTYRDVLEVMKRKFPAATGYPLESAEDLAKHCREQLELRVVTGRGKIKKPTSYSKQDFPPLFDLALRIDP